jgi:hypothetical protein
MNAKEIGIDEIKLAMDRYVKETRPYSNFKSKSTP